MDQPHQIADSFNSYFCEVGSQLLNVDASNVNNVNFSSFLGPSRPNSFYCSNIALHELFDVVANLKMSKSCVGNCVSSFLLKHCIDSVASPLLHIFNLSFDVGIFPSQLKLSRITPIFKKGSRLDLQNYRPISITCPLAKILERLMYARVSNFFDKYNMLYEFQVGFRKKY